MRIADFDYQVPPELIAQEPLTDRAASRLLRLDRATGRIEGRRFAELPDLLRPGDLLVLNNSRVFPARLYGRRAGARAQPVGPHNPAAKSFLRGRVEVLLTCQLDPKATEWEALVHPGRKIGVGERLFFGEQDELQAEVLSRGEYGERRLRFARVEDFFGLVERIGHVPLPPYIDRPDVAADRERYQTVFARERGSVAAPTAGLHFTPEILERLNERGIQTAEITLHVGLGTFQPVHTDVVEEHRLHSESYTVSAAAAEAIQRARDEGRRIVAVGTTSVRTLEHCPRTHPEGKIVAGSDETDIFIYPGFEFRVTGALLTNFHLPRSTLLMLICAFAGRERAMAAYRHAVEERYRFYSYGDCMLVD